MAALTASRMATSKWGGDTLWKLPVAAGAVCFAGGIAMIDAGYVKPGATATGKLCAGRFNKNVDNTGGGAGAKVTEVERGIFKFNNSSAGDLIAQADVGALCYIVDDQTVAKTTGGATRSIAGRIMAVEADGVFVEMGRFAA